MKKIAYVGLDVHKDTITAALLLEDADSAEWVKTFPNDTGRLRKVFDRLTRDYEVRACYEASGAGYCLHRILAGWDIDCDVVAPSLIPKRPGDRCKTDRRDAENLARLHRMGELTAVHVPDEVAESARDLCRCRETFRREVRRCKQYVLKFLRRRQYVYIGSHWTKKHLEWLRSIELGDKDQMILNEYTSLLEYLTSRVEELERQIEELAFSEAFQAQVSHLRAFRGLDLQSAMVLVTELGDARRFSNPRQLMSYWGLTPSEHSSGQKEKRGPITKAGNSRCRHVLLQAAWQYQHKPHVGAGLKKRQEGAPPWLVQLSWKAQHRLHKRYLRLSYRKPKQVAVVAVARELVGFIWAALTENGKDTRPSARPRSLPTFGLKEPTRTYQLDTPVPA